MKPLPVSLSLDPMSPPRPELRKMLYDNVTYSVSSFMSNSPS
jgi:hypothetical protein